jgi:hypothetical protein
MDKKCLKKDFFLGDRPVLSKLYHPCILHTNSFKRSKIKSSQKSLPHRLKMMNITRPGGEGDGGQSDPINDYYEKMRTLSTLPPSTELSDNLLSFLRVTIIEDTTKFCRRFESYVLTGHILFRENGGLILRGKKNKTLPKGVPQNMTQWVRALKGVPGYSESMLYTIRDIYYYQVRKLKCIRSLSSHTTSLSIHHPLKLLLPFLPPFIPIIG